MSIENCIVTQEVSAEEKADESDSIESTEKTTFISKLKVKSFREPQTSNFDIDQQEGSTNKIIRRLFNGEAHGR